LIITFPGTSLLRGIYRQNSAYKISRICWCTKANQHISDFHSMIFCPFLRATAVPAGTAESAYSVVMAILSVCLSVCLSVRPSVTTRWYTKHRWDRDSGSSPYGSLEYL